jgi:ribosomal protein S4
MLSNRPRPPWLEADGELAVRISAPPERSEMEPMIEEHLIVEFYSR